jgi:alpha-glucosidase (family GH31 glycosyl hydrolase)
MHTVMRGGAMVKPVLFEFPEDVRCYSIIDTSFMMGSALRITPVLQDQVDVVDSYFPNADWYHYLPPDYKKVMTYNHSALHGEVLKLHSSLDSENINVHIKSGSIFPRQDVTDGITNILKLHDLPIELIVVPDANQMAKGELFYDSEHHINFYEDHQDILLDMYKNEIKVQITSGRPKIEYNYKDMDVSKITILGAKAYANTLSAQYVTVDHQTVKMKNVNYNPTTEILTLEPPDNPPMVISQVASISWSNTTMAY